MSTATANSAPLLERCFLFDAVEDSYELTSMEGSLPKWVRGSYYVNGPARFERAGQRYKHWLDGDGMICALHFSDDGIRFASRFVQTPKLIEEEAAGRFLYRGFGTAFSDDRLRRGLMLEPPINVSVCHWNQKLLAFGEQALPMELDPATLETIGEYDFSGKLNDVSPFAAHAKLDPASGNLLNFGISFSATQPMLNVYEFNACGSMLRRRRYPLEWQHSNHDFAFTQNHVVFFLSPLLMNFTRFWGERLSVMESLTWEPEKGSRIYVAPRASKDESPFQVPAGEGHCLHLINSYEEGGQLTVDIFELERPVYSEYQPVPELFVTAPRCRPVRYVVDLETRKMIDRKPMAYDLCSDFPAIDARRISRHYNDFWLLGMSATGDPGRKFFDQLAHGSWSEGGVNDIFQVAPGEYLAGEPAFIGNPENHDEGFVIVQHLNAKTDQAAFLLFDAFHVRRGPLARIPLRSRVHPLFHAIFHPAPVPSL